MVPKMKVVFGGRKPISQIYVNGSKEDIEKTNFVEKETKRILNDCIKRPWKYLK